MIIKNGATYFKWSVILIGIILIFLIFRRCGGEGGKATSNDTISVRIDTVWVQAKDSISYIPVPYRVEIPQPYKIQVHDTVNQYLPEYVDSAAILQEFLTKKYYRDTVENKFGYIVIDDTLYKNSIAGRSVRSNFEIPVVKETVTIQQKKRNIVYLGFGAIGGESDLLFATGVNLGWKSKNDKFYQVGGWLTKSGNPMYSFGINIPIKLRKK